MAKLSAARKTRIYDELTEATSEETAEVIVQSLIDAPWDDLVTKDHLDARFAQVDTRFAQVDTRFAQVDTRFAEMEAKIDTGFAQMEAKIEKSMRVNTFRILTTVFAFNGALVAAVAAIH